MTRGVEKYAAATGDSRLVRSVFERAARDVDARDLRRHGRGAGDDDDVVASAHTYGDPHESRSSVEALERAGLGIEDGEVGEAAGVVPADDAAVAEERVRA